MDRTQDTNPNERDMNDEHWKQNRVAYTSKNIGRKYFLIANEKLVMATSTMGPIENQIEREKYDNYLVIHLKKSRPI